MPRFSGGERVVMEGQSSSRPPEERWSSFLLHGNQFNGWAPMAADHDGALLALNFLNQSQALGLKLGDSHLHILTMV
jgi:hypothetical protein